MESIVFLLSILLFICICFLVGVISNYSYYKGLSEAYEQMLIKAGLIDEPPVVEDSGQPSD